MNANLIPLREALAVARVDLAETLPEVRRQIAALHNPALMDLFARLEGDVHEIELLHKRELSILENGREPEPQPWGDSISDLHAAVAPTSEEASA